ncbi:MAG TPA: OmpA family protein [Bradyrhizobium sp.]|nr:OmpA family protein [Bradyrhizobium sp.]
MTNLRLLLLATTAFTAMQFAGPPSHAQTAPLVVAQGAGEVGPDGKPKQPQKGAPPARPAPPAAAPPPPRPAPPPPPPPRAAPPPPPPPPHPAPPPPPPPHPAPPPVAAPPHPAPPPVAAPPHPAPPPPPAAAPPHPAPPPPPAAAPSRPLPPPPAPPPATPKPPAAPTVQPQERIAPTPPPGAKQLPQGPGTPPAAAPQPQPGPSTPPAGGAAGTPPPSGRSGQPSNVPATSPNAAPAPGGGQTALPPGAAPLAHRPPPTVSAPIPAAPPPAQALAPIAPGAATPGPRRMEDFRGARQESDQGGRKVFTEPGRVIVVDPGGHSFIRHNEDERFRYGARDIQTQRVGADTRTIVIRPDGSQIITVVGRDGQLLRRIRRDREGREIIIIDNTYRDPRAFGGFYVDLPPPVLRIPYNRYIVEADDAPPDLIYDTMEAPPVERIDRRYSLDEIRYSPSVRALMPSIDLNSINFETGSWEIPPDQAVKLQAIADGLNRAIARNPREVFLIEGHTDAVGNDVDNLSLSDRRAQSAAELLTQQFGVPAENLTSQGYGSQYLKEQTSGPSRINRRVTIRRITPLLNGGTASLPPPPPGIAPPR